MKKTILLLLSAKKTNNNFVYVNEHHRQIGYVIPEDVDLYARVLASKYRTITDNEFRTVGKHRDKNNLPCQYTILNNKVHITSFGCEIILTHSEVAAASWIPEESKEKIIKTIDQYLTFKATGIPPQVQNNEEE